MYNKNKFFINNTSKISSLFEENKDKEWNEWLEYYKTFKNSGKQGLVGLLKVKNQDLFLIFKISQNIDHLTIHENTIMKGLNDLSNFCPHFCKSYGLINAEVSPVIKKRANPFNNTYRYPIRKDILLMEYIEDSNIFYEYIKSKEIDEMILYSNIKQILLALSISQKQKRFSHYDLHSCNIMLKKCDKNMVFLYVIDEDNQFCVPTNGYYPVIIDYGFSYLKEMDNNPMWCTLAHTNVGFMSDRFDWVADPKLFLVTISQEIYAKRKSKKSKKLKRIVKNIFQPLNIDWTSGWDNIDELGATDIILHNLEKYNKRNSKLFTKYENYCIDLIQTLIILPISEQSSDNIEISFNAFIEEFVKIENEIGNLLYVLYIFKEIVDSARSVRTDYMNEKDRDWAVQTFKKDIFKKTSSISKFVQLKKVKFEKLLCSLFVFAKNIEGLLYKLMCEKMTEKKLEYNKLLLKNTEQIFGVIETNINDKFQYDQDTEVVVLDSVKKTSNIIKIPDEYIKEINNLHSLEKGTYIYNHIYNK